MQFFYELLACNSRVLFAFLFIPDIKMSILHHQDIIGKHRTNFAKPLAK